jgi:lipoprotein-releasing system ATP-binding protein
MPAIVKAENLTRQLPGEVPVTLVRDVDFEIEPGEFVAITGPSGSGKSSLLYLLGLLDKPTRGHIWLNGIDTSGYGENELADLRLKSIGFVFQSHFLLPEFSVLENVTLPMRKLGKLSPEEIELRGRSLLADLGLDSQRNKLPKQLSGGQSQRVAIARALANEPVLIIADEPTGNLDTASSANVRNILRDLAHSGHHAVLVVTHDRQFAGEADRTITMVDGKIVT